MTKKIIIYSLHSIESSLPAGNRLRAFTEYLTSQNILYTLNSQILSVSSSCKASTRSSIFRLATLSRTFRNIVARLHFYPNKYFRSIDGSLLTIFFWRNLFLIFQSRFRGSHYPESVIYVSYKPIANIILGVFHSLLFSLPLVIEQRDLISLFGRKKQLPLLHSIDKTIDRLLCASADFLIFVSPTQLKKASQFYNKPCFLFTNGIDRCPVSKNINLLEAKKIRIVYSGTLSTHRSLKRLSNYIQNSIVSSRIELHVLSLQDPLKFGAPPRTKWLGTVSGSSYHQLLSCYDVFLVLEGDSSDSVENIPSKLFEYLGHNSPIMALANPDSNLVSILESTGYGQCISSQLEFDAFLSKNWKLESGNLTPYLRDNINKNLLDLFNSLTNI